jgi:hypothetical protein
VKLLVDGSVVLLQKNVRSSRIRVSLDEDNSVVGDLEKRADLTPCQYECASSCICMQTYTLLKSLGDHIPERHLGTSGETLVEHLDGDHGVRRGSGDGSHFVSFSFCTEFGCQ